MMYSIVIPVYNGEGTVQALFEEIQTALEPLKGEYEVIFVYDCGPDDSWAVLMQLKSLHPDTIKLVRLSRNYGQHNALICGFEIAAGNFCITMDEDLQHSPADILSLIEEQKRGNYHLVYGKVEQAEHSFFRNFTSNLLRKLIAYGIPEIHPDYSPFRLILTKVAKGTVEMRNSYTFLDGYLSWLTKKVSSAPVGHRERFAGKSSYTIKKLIEHSLNIFFTFSKLPVRLLTFLSITVLISTVIYSSYIIIRKLLFDDLASGFASIIVVLGFGVGFIMLALGIIGEYIYRINLKTTRRPNYNVEEIL